MKRALEGQKDAVLLHCQTEETTFRQEIIDLLEQRTHSEGREGENEHGFTGLNGLKINEHEFHKLHEKKKI